MGPFFAISLILVLFSYCFRRKFKPLLKSLLFLADKTTDKNVDESDKKSLHFFLHGAGVCNETTSCCELDAPKMNPIQSETTIAPEKCPCDGSKRANSSGGQPSDVENLGSFKRITSKSCAHESPSFHGISGHIKRPMATEISFYALSNRDPEYSGESKASQQSDKSNHSGVQAFSSQNVNKTCSENKDLYKGKAVLEINHLGCFHETGEASNQVSSSFGKQKSCEQHSLEYQNDNHQRRRYFLLHPRGSSQGIKSDSGRRKSDSDRIFQQYRWSSAYSDSEDCLNVRSSDFFSPHAHRNQVHPEGHGKNKPSSISWESSPVALTPIFGDWDEDDPRSGEGFTYMFEKLKREKIASSKFPDLLPIPINYESPPEKQGCQTSASKIFCCFGFKKKERSAR